MPEVSGGGEAIDRELARDLLRRADALNAEADDVLADLDLHCVLTRAGEVTRVGSAAFALMVRRDVDLCVVCDDWDADAAFAAAEPLASHPRVGALSFRNETGRFDSGFPTDGYYWGMRDLADSGVEWNLDVWFWSRGAPPDDLVHAAEMRRWPTPETSAEILRIKDVHQRPRPSAEDPVASVDVYAAALDHGARTPAGFAAYLAERRDRDADG